MRVIVLRKTFWKAEVEQQPQFALTRRDHSCRNDCTKHELTIVLASCRVHASRRAESYEVCCITTQLDFLGLTNPKPKPLFMTRLDLFFVETHRLVLQRVLEDCEQIQRNHKTYHVGCHKAKQLFRHVKKRCKDVFKSLPVNMVAQNCET